MAPASAAVGVVLRDHHPLGVQRTFEGVSWEVAQWFLLEAHLDCASLEVLALVAAGALQVVTADPNYLVEASFDLALEGDPC